MAASWDAVQMMLGKIWTRLEVIDKLAEAQGKLCQRLDELEKALGRLDPNAAAGVAATSPQTPSLQGDAKIPAMTSVYDPITKGIKLITMEQYERHYAKIPAPTYVAMYNPEKQSVDLMFEKHYLESDHYAKDLKARLPGGSFKSAPIIHETAAPIIHETTEPIIHETTRKPKPVPEYTCVYDPATQESKLMLWNKYVSQNKAPTTDWAMKYNPKKQGIDLVFWRNYQPGGGYKVLSVNDFF